MQQLKKIAKNTAWSLINLLMTGLFLLICLYFYATLALPDVKKLKDLSFQAPLKVYTNDGKLIGEFGEKRRIPIAYEEVPNALIQALLATEDRRFFSHSGVDMIGLARATKKLILTGEKSEGASTITMQVARNFFLTPHKTFTRKFNEILLAIKIDRLLPKQRILELYLNKIFLGYRAYGVQAAAAVYYGKSLNDLNLAQLAMIAGLPKAPSRDNPLRNPTNALKRRNHVLMRMYKERYINLETFENAIAQPLTASYHKTQVHFKAPYIAEMARQALVQKYDKDVYNRGWKVYTTIDSNLQYQAKKALVKGLLDYTKRHGYQKSEVNLFVALGDDKAAWQNQLTKLPVFEGGVRPAAVLQVAKFSAKALLSDGKVVTIEWPGLAWARPRLENGKKIGGWPKQARDILDPGDLIHVIKNAQSNWMLVQLSDIQGALVALNPNNGAILALVGGINYQASHFNRAVQAWRQPASAFKPFIYTAALEAPDKGYTLATLINDAPVVLQDSGENILWRPQNHTLIFHGPTRMRSGLVFSRNLMSVRILQDIGLTYTINYLKRFGFSPNKHPKTLSLALGSGAVTPLQITSAYAIFANGGYSIKPYLIDHITDEKNQVLYKKNPLIVPKKREPNQPLTAPQVVGNKQEDWLHRKWHRWFDEPTSANPHNPRFAPRVIKKQTAYLINDVLKGVIQHGTGRRAKVLGRQDLAGKTGTTEKLIDAWFIGYNPDIVTGVWLGFDQNQPTHEYASKLALPVWIHFMGAALSGKPEHSLPIPPGIVSIKINPKTGLPAMAGDPYAINEFFRADHLPSSPSETFTEFTPANKPIVSEEQVY